MNEPNNGSVIGDEATYRTFSAQYNRATRRKQLIHEEHNSAYNHHTLVERLNAGTARDIGAEEKQSGPCFVIGSGPSLDDALPYMKGWKDGIICTTSHALTLMYYGIEPSHILLLDPFCSWDEIAGVDWSQTRTKLVAHPGVWPDIIANWPNDILLYRQNMGNAEPFYNGTQSRMYTRREGVREATFHFLINTQITVFACSPPMQMFVAQVLGYSRIYLAGVDFAYHSGKDRFTEYTVKKPAYTIATKFSEPVVIGTEWEKHEHPFVEKEDHDYIRMDNGLLSEQVHLYYKKNLMSAWRLSLQDTYTTDHGAITEIPYVSIRDAVLGYPKKRFPVSRIKRISEKYMARVGAYVIESSQGLSFVEVAEPLKDLPAYMHALQRNYVCGKCGATGTAHDDADHTGEQCTNCGAREMKRALTVDVEKNMKRIRKLLEITASTSEPPASP